MLSYDKLLTIVYLYVNIKKEVNKLFIGVKKMNNLLSQFWDWMPISYEEYAVNGISQLNGSYEDSFFIFGVVIHPYVKRRAMNCKKMLYESRED